MDLDTMGFALAAGLVAAVNPCGFAMLPAYLSLVVVGEEGAGNDRRSSKVAAIVRALAATAMMALGFLLVFGTFGLVIAPLASSVQQYLPAVTVVIGPRCWVWVPGCSAGGRSPCCCPNPVARAERPARLRCSATGWRTPSLHCRAPAALPRERVGE